MRVLGRLSPWVERVSAPIWVGWNVWQWPAWAVRVALGSVTLSRISPFRLPGYQLEVFNRANFLTELRGRGLFYVREA